MKKKKNSAANVASLGGLFYNYAQSRKARDGHYLVANHYHFLVRSLLLAGEPTGPGSLFRKWQEEIALGEVEGYMAYEYEVRILARCIKRYAKEAA